MRRLTIKVVLVALVSGGVSCTDSSGRDPGSATASVTLPASRAVDVRRSPWARLQAHVPKGYELLAVRSAGDDLAVVGRRRPVPWRVTGSLVFEARLMDGRGKLRAFPEGVRVLLDAVFSPDGKRLALVTRRGELYLWRLDEPTPRLVDGRVVAGLSFSPDSKRLAYARGIAPELDVWTTAAAPDASVRFSRTRITRLPGPTLLPTFGPDGRRLLFVSSHGGRPALYVTPDTGGTLARLGVDEPGVLAALVPTTRRPALWRRGAIVFESGRDVLVLSATGRLRHRIHDASRPHWVGRAELAYRRRSDAKHPYRQLRVDSTGGTR